VFVERPITKKRENKKERRSHITSTKASGHIRFQSSAVKVKVIHGNCQINHLSDYSRSSLLTGDFAPFQSSSDTTSRGMLILLSRFHSSLLGATDLLRGTHTFNEISLLSQYCKFQLVGIL